MTTVRDRTAPSPQTLDEVLSLAVDRGILSYTKADEVRALASTPSDLIVVPEVARPSMRPVVAEILGYVGGALAVGAGIAVGQEIWTDLNSGVRVGVLVVVALAAWAAGVALHATEGAAGRLASFLWVLAVAAAAGAAATVAYDWVGYRDEAVPLTAFATASVVAAGLWWVRRAPLQEVVTFGALAFTGSLTLVQLFGDDYPGVWVLALSLAWLVLAWRERIVPAVTGMLLGTVGLLIAPPMIGALSEEWVSSLGLLVAAAVVVGGIRMRHIPVAVLGVIGLFVYVPPMLSAVFGETATVMVVAFLIGVGLVTAAVVLARRSRHD
jgi:hypothetical protein